MQEDFNIYKVDRYPLVSQRGNFSGKASAIVKSLISGLWWLSDPITGKVPDTVERNNQFHLNQGPVDMSIGNAKETQSFTSLQRTNPGLLGTYLPRNTLNNEDIVKKFTPKDQTDTFSEVYIWHPFTTKTESFIEFSVNPTKY